MIDTHTHLQFQVFEGIRNQVIKNALESGIKKIVVVGTNLETSIKAVELAKKYPEVYASVGIHPHHIFDYLHSEKNLYEDLQRIEELISNIKVVALGETGMDRHNYPNTKYPNYGITQEFINLQKRAFEAQIKLAVKHNKALIIHNRGAVTELLEVLKKCWDPVLENRSVFHCCEPDHGLLRFARNYNVFLGIDGDITYHKKKQDFMKQIPLEQLVLETDSPYFVPEPLKTQGVKINEPKNICLIAEFISKLKNEPLKNVQNLSRINAKKLFNI
jgi:TatD DNase family protein